MRYKYMVVCHAGAFEAERFAGISLFHASYKPMTPMVLAKKLRDDVRKITRELAGAAAFVDRPLHNAADFLDYLYGAQAQQLVAEIGRAFSAHGWAMWMNHFSCQVVVLTAVGELLSGGLSLRDYRHGTYCYALSRLRGSRG